MNDLINLLSDFDIIDFEIKKIEKISLVMNDIFVNVTYKIIGKKYKDIFICRSIKEWLPYKPSLIFGSWGINPKSCLRENNG